VKRKLLTLVLYVYAVVGLLVSMALMLLLGPAADVQNATSVRLLGAALFSLGIGAVVAAREPSRNKSLLVVEIFFTALATLVLILKVVIHHSHADFDERVYLVLAPTLVCLVLLVITFPYGEQDAGKD